MKWVKGQAEAAAADGGIFDLDGTLLDSLWVWEEVDRRFLQRRGIAVPSDYMHAVSLMEYSRAAEYTIERFGLTDGPRAVMDEWTELSVGAYERECKLKAGVKDYLIELAARGVKLAVATSATPEMCFPALERNGILDMFEAIVTTSEIGRGKAFPDVYLRAAKIIKLAPASCAVYEDNLRALLTAKNAGFFTVGVFDEYSRADTDEMLDKADAFLHF